MVIIPPEDIFIFSVQMLVVSSHFRMSSGAFDRCPHKIQTGPSKNKTIQNLPLKTVLILDTKVTSEVEGNG